MVQQQQQPNAPADAKPAASATIKEDYDLEKIVTDRSAIILRSQTFIDNVLIPIDRLFRKVADPANPYLKVGDTTPTQYTHALVSDFVNKGIPYILSKDYTVRFPAGLNPSASLANLALCARLVRRVFDFNARGGRCTVRRRAKLIGIRGGYAIQYAYRGNDSKDQAKETNTGFPVPSWLFDPLDVQAVREPSEGKLRRVIMAKRRIAGDLPIEFQGDHDPTEQVDVYEHWDRINHGVVLNGSEIVKPLTPHGYVDREGEPMVPWVIVQHDEGEYVFGDSDPTSQAITPLKTLVGHPPAEDLIEATQHLSFMLTLLRFTAVNSSLFEKVIKGQVIYSKERRAYVVEDPSGGVEILDTGVNLPHILSITQYFQSLGEQSGMGQGLLSGQVKEASGTAVQQQTDLVKSKLEDVRTTLERGMAEEAEMILALVSSNTQPSTAQLYQRKYGKALPAKNPDASHNYTNGTPLPMSNLITGNDYDQVTSLTLEGARFCDVSVNAVDGLPKEQKIQIGMTLLTSDKSPFDPVEVMEEFFDKDNAQESYNRGLLAKLYANPQLPFSDLAALKAMLQEKEGEMDPQVLEGLRQQIAQAEQMALTNTVTAKLKAIMAGGNPGSSTPQGQPNGQPQPQGQPPPGAIPPGQQAQPVGGMSPGASPPVQPPPMPMPPQAPLPQPMPQMMGGA